MSSNEQSPPEPDYPPGVPSRELGLNTSYFTFGTGHSHALRNGETYNGDCVLRVVTRHDPRDFMFALFGPRWCGEYDTQEDVGMEHFPRGLVYLGDEDLRGLGIDALTLQPFPSETA